MTSAVDVFAPPRIVAERGADGAILVRSTDAPGEHAPSMAHLFRAGRRRTRTASWRRSGRSAATAGRRSPGARPGGAPTRSPRPSSSTASGPSARC